MSRALPLVFLCSLLAGCSGAPAGATVIESQSLTVFAAASLTEAFTELGAGFESDHPGVRVMFSFGGSQILRTQIEAGAPADVFASANLGEMEALVEDDLISADAPRVFLSNQLVVILPAANPAGLQQLQHLSRPGLKIVLAAEEVPAGDYARRALEKMNVSLGSDFSTLVLANVVSNEDNVKQVVAKIQLGEADAGIVYASDAIAAPDLKTLEIVPALNLAAQYPIAVLSGSARPYLAQRFIDYVLSPPGQTILEKWGFGPAP